MKALIFGVRGQDGYYLKKLLSQKNITCIGISRSETDSNFTRRGDVGNAEFVTRIVSTEKPDYIFHLAANSSTRHDALFENHETISTGTLNILEATWQHARDARVFITGSGVQFENNGAPIHEHTPFKANNPYAISRIQSVYAARYFRSLGLRTYVGYLFHHESPLRKPHHVSKIIADHVRGISAGASNKIKLGDTRVVKEWAFAGDVAEAIFKLVGQEAVYEATIGTGRGYSIENWLAACFNVIGKSWMPYIELPDPDFKPEYPVLLSDPSTMHGLGWKAETTFEKLAELMVLNEFPAIKTESDE